jgi:hypothetical protein
MMRILIFAFLAERRPVVERAAVGPVDDGEMVIESLRLRYR